MAQAKGKGGGITVDDLVNAINELTKDQDKLRAAVSDPQFIGSQVARALTPPEKKREPLELEKMVGERMNKLGNGIINAVTTPFKDAYNFLFKEWGPSHLKGALTVGAGILGGLYLGGAAYGLLAPYLGTIGGAVAGGAAGVAGYFPSAYAGQTALVYLSHPIKSIGKLYNRVRSEINSVFTPIKTLKSYWEGITNSPKWLKGHYDNMIGAGRHPIDSYANIHEKYFPKPKEENGEGGHAVAGAPSAQKKAA